MENNYAEALKRMVEGGKSPKAAVSALENVLQGRGRTALLPKIAYAFKKLVEKERRRNTITLSVSKEGQARSKKEAKEILRAMQVDADDVETKIDDTLIGGWRLEGREHLYDASFKKHLLSIYAKVIGQ